MTILQPTAAAAPAPSETVLENVLWVEPERDFWVGTTRGDFVGTIERIDGIYVARGARGQNEGEHPDLDTARRHLTARH